VVINARCSSRIEADQRAIVIGGLPVHHDCANDAVAEVYAMVFLVEQGLRPQTDGLPDRGPEPTNSAIS